MIAVEFRTVRWFNTTTLTWGRPVDVGYLGIDFGDCQLCCIDATTYFVLEVVIGRQLPNAYTFSVATFPYSLNPLPPMNRMRLSPGLVFHNDVLFVFGGNVQVKPDDHCLMRRSAETMHLGDRWVFLGSNMTVARSNFTPCVLRGKVYLVQNPADKVDVFDLSRWAFDPPVTFSARVEGLSVGFIIGEELFFVSDGQVLKGRFGDKYQDSCGMSHCQVANTVQPVVVGQSAFWTQELLCCRAMVQDDEVKMQYFILKTGKEIEG